jgi:hypothetical protein
MTYAQPLYYKEQETIHWTAVALRTTFSRTSLLYLAEKNMAECQVRIQPLSISRWQDWDGSAGITLGIPNLARPVNRIDDWHRIPGNENPIFRGSDIL